MTKRRKRRARGLGSNKVLYTAQKGLFEKVEYGPPATVTGGRCAVLKRFGRTIAGFLMTAGQVKSYERGERINVTDKATVSAQSWCEFHSTKRRSY